MRILKKKGKVEVFKQDYLRFKSNSKKSNVEKLVQELLFFVIVD